MARAVRVIRIGHGVFQNNLFVGPEAFHAAYAGAFDVHPDLGLPLAVGKRRNVLDLPGRIVAMPGNDLLFLQIGDSRHCAVGQYAPENVAGIALPGREDDRGIENMARQHGQIRRLVAVGLECVTKFAD